MVDLKGNPFYLKDEQIAWVNRTLENLTLDEKVGQLFCPIGMSTDEKALFDLAANKKVGGLLFRPGKGEEVQQAHRYLQQQAKVPMLIAANLEAGGTGSAIDGTRIGNPMLLAAGQDAEFGHHLGEVCAKEGSAVGVNWAFAPVVDIDYNFHNPITNVRTYGSDPETVLNYAKGFVEAVQQNGVAASIKHFPGDGIDFRDQHLVTTVNTLPLEEWRSTYGKVYSGLIEAGSLSVMIGHIALPAVQKSEEDAFLPATLSPVIMQELLREELGFNGVITSDATPMVGFCAAMERRLAVPTAIAAGCDIFLFNKDLEEDIRFMKEGIENGILKLERIDEAVTRILAMKAALKLPEKQADALLVPAKEELGRPAGGTTRPMGYSKPPTMASPSSKIQPVTYRYGRTRRLVCYCNCSGLTRNRIPKSLSNGAAAVGEGRLPGDVVSAGRFHDRIRIRFPVPFQI
ncbi:MAG: glycoside hydrolase family 3 N-terminal domain-containing protein [Trichococcus flocculiformis]